MNRTRDVGPPAVIVRQNVAQQVNDLAFALRDARQWARHLDNCTVVAGNHHISARVAIPCICGYAEWLDETNRNLDRAGLVR